MSSKHYFISVISLLVILLCRPCLAIDTAPVGWATYNDLGLNGVTGGAGGETVIVTTGEDLKDYIGRTDPYIILVQGAVTMAQTEVKPNKTIIGIGANPTVIGGFRIKRSSNVIIRNLIIRDSSYDGFSVEYDTHHVWIDHCDISNCTDGLLDITHACDYVTVSWNRFSNHHKTCLLGHADDNGDEDIGHLKVTYHHNWFDGTSSRHPRVRFSYLTHVFNNYYYGNSYGIASTCDAEVLVEGCYFLSVGSPTLVGYGTSWAGDLVSRDNISVGSGSYETRGTVPEASDYYSYTLDAAADVPAIVTAGAGLFPEEYDEPPVPNTMTWFAVPQAVSSSEITMTASTAYDYSGVEYYFDCLTPGGHDSGWQIGSTYTDTGLESGTSYTYQVQARDTGPNHNTTGWSDEAVAITDPWACTASIPEDLSGDCQVNLVDFSILAAQWMNSAPPATELVVNGDFTTDLSGWTTTPHLPTTITWDSGTALLARNEATDASNGNYLYQVIPVVGGRRYKIDAQWKGDLLNGGTGRNWAEVLVAFSPSPVTAFSLSTIYSKATDGGPNAEPMPWGWESILLSPDNPSSPADGIFTAPESYMLIAFNLGGDADVGPGYFYIDNVSVVEYGGTTCPEIIEPIDDCQLNLDDLEALAAAWLNCNRVPAGECWQ